MTATTETSKGYSGKYIQIQFVLETGKTRTVDKLDNPPSKVRTLWYVRLVA
jgi:hypothetical protein